MFVLRSEAGDAPLRRFDAASRTLHLSADLQPSQQAFQLATQLALLELQPQMQTLLATHHWQDEATRRLASIGLANYVAGALTPAYGRFCRRPKAWATTLSCWASALAWATRWCATASRPCSARTRRGCRF